MTRAANILERRQMAEGGSRLAQLRELARQADEGGSGVDLSKLSREERRQRLLAASTR